MSLGDTRHVSCLEDEGLQWCSVDWVYSWADWNRDVASGVTVAAPGHNVLVSCGRGVIAHWYPFSSSSVSSNPLWGVELCPPKKYVQVLTPGACEFDSIWE